MEGELLGLYPSIFIKHFLQSCQPHTPLSSESKALMWGSAERRWEKQKRANNMTTITKTSVSPRLLEDTLLAAESHTER